MLILRRIHLAPDPLGIDLQAPPGLLFDTTKRGVSGSSTDHGEEASGRHRPGTAMAEALGKLVGLGGIMTVNTSLFRECLELILMLADALDRKRARPPRAFEVIC